MAPTAAKAPGSVSRTAFMLGVMGALGTAIGVVYVGVLFRYLYPKNASDTPPLKVTLADTGVTVSSTGTQFSFQNGVAGPIVYPTTTDGSVVVGVFVEKRDVNGPLTPQNLMVVEQTCTHLGCPVIWNPNAAEDNQSGSPPGRYQCPCHGSQFHRDLSVAHGPANDPLHTHEFDLSGTTLTIKKKA